MTMTFPPSLFANLQCSYSNSLWWLNIWQIEPSISFPFRVKKAAYDEYNPAINKLLKSLSPKSKRLHYGIVVSCLNRLPYEQFPLAPTSSLFFPLNVFVQKLL